MKKKLNKFGAQTGPEENITIIDHIGNPYDVPQETTVESQDSSFMEGAAGSSLEATQSTIDTQSFEEESINFVYCDSQQNILLDDRHFKPEEIASHFVDDLQDISAGNRDSLINSVSRLLEQSNENIATYKMTATDVKKSDIGGSQYGTPNLYINFYSKFIKDGLQNHLNQFFLGTEASVILENAKNFSGGEIGVFNSNHTLFNRVVFYNKIINDRHQVADQLRVLINSVESYKKLFSGLSKLALYCNYPVGIIELSTRNTFQSENINISSGLNAKLGHLLIEIFNLRNKKTSGTINNHPLISLTRAIFDTVDYLLNDRNTNFIIVFLFNAELRTILQLIAGAVSGDCLNVITNHDYSTPEEAYSTVQEFLTQTTVDRKQGGDIFVINQNIDEIWEIFTEHLQHRKFGVVANQHQFKAGVPEKYRAQYLSSLEPLDVVEKLWFFDFLSKSIPLYTSAASICSSAYIAYSTASCGVYFYHNKVPRYAQIAQQTIGAAASSIITAGTSEIRGTVARAGSDFILTKDTILSAIASVAKNIPLLINTGFSNIYRNPKISFMIFSIVWISGETYINSIKNAAASSSSVAAPMESPNAEPDIEPNDILKNKIAKYIYTILNSFKPYETVGSTNNENIVNRAVSIYDFLNNLDYIGYLHQNHGVIFNNSLDSDTLVLFENFEQLDIYKDLLIYTIIQANPHLILDANNILVQLAKTEQHFIYSGDKGSIIPTNILALRYAPRAKEIQNIYNVIISDSAKYMVHKDDKATIMNGEVNKSFIDATKRHWKELVEMFNTSAENSGQSQSVKAVKALFGATKRWLIKETQSESVVSFGNIMKPYRRHIVSYKGDGYPELETSFGRLKLKDNKKGLYVSGGGKKWYLYRWGDKIQKIKIW